MKILVTGAAGFVGSNLVKSLCEDGHNVSAFDNLSNGLIVNLTDENQEQPRFIKGMEHNFLDRENIVDVLNAYDFDFIYHLAANANVPRSVEEPNYDFENNILLTHTIIDTIRKQGKKTPIAFTSSACFVAGTKVITNKGFVPIESINSDYKVLSEDGQWHNVEKMIERDYDGPLCKIHALSANDILSTPDHRMLLKGRRWEQAVNTDRLEIEEVKPNLEGDANIAICFASDKYLNLFREVKNNDISLYELGKKYGVSSITPYRWAKSKLYPKKLEPVTKDTISKTYDLGRLLGLILSEGWCEKSIRWDSERIVCAFGKHEIELKQIYIDLLQKVLGIPLERIVVNDVRTSTKIHVTSKRFVKLLRELAVIDCGGDRKQLSPFGILGPDEYRRGILDGANEGDGAKQEIGGFMRDMWATSSEILSLQYSLILKSLSIHNSISIRPEGTWNIEGRSGESKKLYQIYSKINNTEVQSVEIIHSMGTIKVYNLEVQDVHSYVVEGVIVHNCVYGDLPYAGEEDSDPAKPISPYGATKAAGEDLLLGYSRSFDIPVVVYRLSNLYGRNQKHYVMMDLYKKIKSNKDELFLLGTGHNKRDYVYVDDGVQALKMAMTRLEDMNGGIFNVSTGLGTEIIDLVDMMVKKLNIVPKISYSGQSWVGDIMNLTADSSKIRNLGWNPTIDLSEGMDKFLVYAKSRFGAI